MSLRIFVTTDNHVGYNETDPVQYDDAANSFEEAMTIAKNADVDFVIQAGDLFHVNKPTKRALYSVIRTLRRTCLGDKPVEFEVLNFDKLALDDASDFDHPNFEDLNLNVGLPVFAISGNHDDAAGTVGSEMLSPLDVLSMAGLLNHFGRVFDSAKIVVKPILIEKAGIRLALYGIASVRDERLYRTFRENRVKFVRPREDPDSWYNILVVHQNRVPHGPTNFLPEAFLPNFVDLVIWGHEHDPKVDPKLNHEKGFAVMQPGSTVITSLHESEMQQKHVAIISIGANRSFSYEKIPLKTVRPFAMRTISLHEETSINPGHRDARAKVTEFLIDQVEELIKEAESRWNKQHERDDDESNAEPGLKQPLPLIRLRVDYTGYDVENTTRFSNRFVNRVANASNVLSLIKRRVTSAKLGAQVGSLSAPGDPRLVNNIKQVGQLLRELLTSEELKILPERKMSEALTRFVEKDEKLALKNGVDDLVQAKVSSKLTASVDDMSIRELPDSGADSGVKPRSVASGRQAQEAVSSMEPARLETESPDVVVSDSEDDLPPRRASRNANSRVSTSAHDGANRGVNSESVGVSRAARAARANRPTFEPDASPPFEDDSDDMFSQS